MSLLLWLQLISFGAWNYSYLLQYDILSQVVQAGGHVGQAVLRCARAEVGVVTRTQVVIVGRQVVNTPPHHGTLVQVGVTETVL